MDSRFCAPFHQLKITMGSAANAQLFVNSMTYGLMGLGLLFYICVFCAVCMRVTGLHDDHEKNQIDDEDGDGKISCSERFNAGVREISHINPFFLTLFILLLFLPPLLERQIFSPCFDCYDYESAALHEIGHFLGLGHPNNIPLNWAYPANQGNLAFAGPKQGQNSYQSLISSAIISGNRPDPAKICMDPWKDVKAGTPPNANDIDPTSLPANGGMYPAREAQMEARTQHNPSSCLRDDDLEALNVLYPDCGAYAMSTNVCHNVQSNLGVVRVAAYILFPSILALLGVIICSSIVHAFERREQKRFREAHMNLHAEHQKVKAEQHHSRRQRGKTPSTSKDPRYAQGVDTSSTTPEVVLSRA